MNLKNNNGFTGIDISISMIIIMIFIPTIFGISYNIQKTNTSVKREETAISIATEVLEIAKSQQFGEISLSSGSAFLTDLENTYYETTYTNEDTKQSGYDEYIYYQAIEDDDKHYQIQISLLNYFPDDATSEEKQGEGLVKKINVLVLYPVGDDLESINISTIIQNS